MNLDVMSELYLAALCAVGVVVWLTREIAVEIRAR